MKTHSSFPFLSLAAALGLSATSPLLGASGDSAPFLLDTRNYTASPEHTVHTDKRAYLATDSVPGSLRQAIANASSGESVDFDAGFPGGTIILGGSQLTLDKDLTIDASALPDGLVIDAGGSSRVFKIGSGSTVMLTAMTLTGGKAPDGAVGATGSSGGLSSFGGSGGPGGAGQSGGGILNEGTLTLNGMTLSGNAAGNGGRGGTGGSGLVQGNGGKGGVGGSGGALYNSATGTVSISNGTIAGNLSGSGGPGGPGSLPGAGGNGGGGGGVLNLGSLTVTHGTMARNATGSGSNSGIILGVPGTGGGIQNTGSLTFTNSILALNTGSPDPDLAGPITTGSGVNLIGGDPLLAPLGDYGGTTETMALRAGSLAINAAGATALTKDQRGFNRIGAPDIGAYESGNAVGYSVWATEMISEGLDASFAGNADEDPSANGTEYALGTGVLISDPTSPNNPEVITNGAGEIEITFGFNPIAAVDTRWIIERTTDLKNFTEIYRYDGPSSTSTPVAGVSANVGATTITVTDTNPPTPNVFYRFGAQTAP